MNTVNFAQSTPVTVMVGAEHLSSGARGSYGFVVKGRANLAKFIRANTDLNLRAIARQLAGRPVVTMGSLVLTHCRFGGHEGYAVAQAPDNFTEAA